VALQVGCCVGGFASSRCDLLHGLVQVESLRLVVVTAWTASSCDSGLCAGICKSACWWWCCCCWPGARLNQVW
jgi:hypothetical protein